MQIIYRSSKKNDTPLARQVLNGIFTQISRSFGSEPAKREMPVRQVLNGIYANISRSMSVEHVRKEMPVVRENTCANTKNACEK